MVCPVDGNITNEVTCPVCGNAMPDAAADAPPDTKPAKAKKGAVTSG